MATTNLNIRTDKAIKDQAEEIFNELGLNMTTAVNIFLRTAIREHGIPFELKLDVPNETTAAAIEEGRKMMSDPSAPRYSSMDALKAAGFPEKQIYQVPTKSNDIPGAFDAANSMLVQHPEVKHWLIVGMNDSTVLGGVRATEGQGFKAADIIGIGINGVDAVSELSKAQATGFYGSLLPSPDVHGYKSSEMLYNWVAKDVEPPKFTEVTDVVLITRDNFKEELEKKGLGGK